MLEDQHILTEAEFELNQEPASPGMRFLNFIIDTIAYYIIAFGVGFVLALILISMRNSGSARDYSTADDGSLQLLIFFLYLGIILAYYMLMEKLSKGRTIGKFITGTKVVSIYGGDITWKQAFLRSVIRFIPFEPLSAFGGNPWHDQWADTKVVKVR